MAVDEALLESTGSGQARPTLRLYAWEPACLSLGYAQPFADVDLARLAELGWELVRRPTGGRAILHTDELTYSITGPQTEPRLAGTVLESYRSLSFGLLNALRRLGIPCESQAEPMIPAGSDPKGPVCFEVPSNYEITVQGKKLIGSAQARRREGVLQHGSLPLHGDLARIVQVLKFNDEATRQAARERLHRRAVTVEEILGYVLPWETAVQALSLAFQEILNLDLERSELTPGEQQRARTLLREKYADSSWTQKI